MVGRPAMSLDTALEQHFGFTAFRPGQEEAVQAAVAGRDVLVVMPTGAGKSLCYQLPALVREDLTLVVSPLVSLMQDQVEALEARAPGRVGLVNAQRDGATNAATVERAVAGELQLLYVAPERFGSPGFLEAVKGRVGLFVVDEAHCVSQWGHDFRPDYFRLADAARYLGAEAIIASTATATPQVARDIEARLGLADPVRVTTGFDRPNLAFAVVPCKTAAAKHRRIAAALKEPGATPAIVYAGTRKGVDRLAESLATELDREVLCYHAGLDRGERATAQRRFMAGEVDVVVATNAFGMGVDKADVRTVVHESVPGSLEAYYQEAGRAGRDGASSRALLFAEGRDKGLHVFFIQRSEVDDALVERVAGVLAFRGMDGRYDVELRELAADPDEGERLRAVIGHLAQAGVVAPTPAPVERLRGRLIAPFDGAARARTRTLVADGTRARWRQYRSIWAYVEGETCRRQAILSHFGDELAPVSHGSCCDVCDPSLLAAVPDPAPRARAGGNGAPADIDEAIVATVAAAEPACGRTRVVEILRGGRSKKLLEHSYDGLPSYGSFDHLSASEVLDRVDGLITAGRLRSTGGAYPKLVAQS
jgi:ATP-dependent DNA helicase RecQ